MEIDVVNNTNLKKIEEVKRFSKTKGSPLLWYRIENNDLESKNWTFFLIYLHLGFDEITMCKQIHFEHYVICQNKAQVATTPGTLKTTNVKQRNKNSRNSKKCSFFLIYLHLVFEEISMCKQIYLNIMLYVSTKLRLQQHQTL